MIMNWITVYPGLKAQIEIKVAIVTTVDKMHAREGQMSIFLEDGRIHNTSRKLDTFVLVKDSAFKHMLIYKGGSSH